MKKGFVALLMAVLFLSIFSDSIAYSANSTPNCLVTPDPVALNGFYTVSGSGYRITEPLLIYLTSPLGEQYIWNVFSDEVGSMHPFTTNQYSYEAGGFSIRVYYGFGPRHKLLTTCSFMVQ